MRTRAVLATTGVATAGLVCAGLFAGQQAASADTTLKAREKFTATYIQDVGKKGTSMGDRLVFTSVLRDPKGTKLADSGGECVVLSGKSDTDAKYQCTQNYRFTGGDVLMAGGPFTFAKKVNKWSIMGGTGKYRGAAGQVDFTTLTADSFADVFRFDS